MKKILLIAITILTIGLSTPSFAGDEGIKVHGRWTFDIYNADGSFDRKVEFDNSLDPIGAETLLHLLNKNTSHNINTWYVSLKGSSNSQPSSNLCLDTSNNFVPCLITEDPQTGNPPTPNVFLNLTYGLDDVNDPTKLILTGSFTTAMGLPADMVIDRARTLTNLINFTRKTQLNIAVGSGQLVQVKVEISFS